MGVHVGEIHTDIATSAGAGSEAPAAAPAPPGAAQEHWSEFRRAAEVLALRTACEGFDD